MPGMTSIKQEVNTWAPEGKVKNSIDRAGVIRGNSFTQVLSIIYCSSQILTESKAAAEKDKVSPIKCCSESKAETFAKKEVGRPLPQIDAIPSFGN